MFKKPQNYKLHVQKRVAGTDDFETIYSYEPELRLPNERLE